MAFLQTRKTFPHSCRPGRKHASRTPPSFHRRAAPATQRPRTRPLGLAPPNPAAGIGTRLTFSFRPFRFSPVRVQWEAEVTEFSWNTQFCDRQVRGPFAYWHHCHRVRAVIREEVAVAVLTDHVEYALPMGALGTLAHRLFLRRRIDQAFAYRYSQLASILGARQTGNSSVATRLDRSA